MPDPVECVKGVRRLVIGSAFGCRHDHRFDAAEAQFEPHVVGPKPFDHPVDEDDPAGDVGSLELPAPSAADADELTVDAGFPGLRHAPERRAFEPRPVDELDKCVL